MRVAVVFLTAANRSSRDLIGDTPTESPSASMFAPNMRRLCKVLRTGVRDHPFPIKQRPDIGPSLAAGCADEPSLQIGEPDVIRPWVGADREGLAALVIRAIDQDAAHASIAHLSEGDLDRSRHTAIEARPNRVGNSPAGRLQCTDFVRKRRTNDHIVGPLRAARVERRRSERILFSLTSEFSDKSSLRE
jgi:hypothetical protein